MEADISTYTADVCAAGSAQLAQVRHRSVSVSHNGPKLHVHLPPNGALIVITEALNGLVSMDQFPLSIGTILEWVIAIVGCRQPLDDEPAPNVNHRMRIDPIVNREHVMSDRQYSLTEHHTIIYLECPILRRFGWQTKTTGISLESAYVSLSLLIKMS